MTTISNSHRAKAYLPLILIGILATAFYFGAISLLVFQLQPPLELPLNVSNQTPTINILLYMGEMPDGRFGFGPTLNSLTSPGPTLRFTTSDIVNITVINAGKLPHTFAITNMPLTGATVLFNSEIGSDSNPVQPGQEASVIFKANNAGASYCYLSQVSGDVEAGMWGSVVMNTISGS